MDVAALEREALSLTVAKRALLADRLLQMLDQADRDRMGRWGREADRRLKANERGEIASVDGPEAVAAIRRRLG
jgi:hypothetical protein